VPHSLSRSVAATLRVLAESRPRLVWFPEPGDHSTLRAHVAQRRTVTERLADCGLLTVHCEVVHGMAQDAPDLYDVWLRPHGETFSWYDPSTALVLAADPASRRAWARGRIRASRVGRAHLVAADGWDDAVLCEASRRWARRLGAPSDVRVELEGNLPSTGPQRWHAANPWQMRFIEEESDDSAT
jgi:hypothetical protein